jgi:hypothetical protein
MTVSLNLKKKNFLKKTSIFSSLLSLLFNVNLSLKIIIINQIINHFLSSEFIYLLFYIFIIYLYQIIEELIQL